MNLFADYVQPLTTWLHDNPQWALTITFAISFGESLAIIGSIVPGSVTMTAIGILAGSGVMRIDLTLLAAIAGAILGDNASYFLGYYFRDRLINVWPFSRHPHWLTLGKHYFSRHGGKSVLIGRFFGPLRPVIPVIAGMMHMSQWKFLIANVISAIGWSIVYVVPGILIGAASNELSAENATRLFLFILVLLICIWLLSIIIKKFLTYAKRILSLNLHEFWLWSRKHPALSKYFLAITPIDEQDHYPTAALVILTTFNIFLLLALLIFLIEQNWINKVNYSVHLFLQSLRITEIDSFMLLLSQLISAATLITSSLAVILFFIYKKNIRVLSYLISIMVSSFLIAKGLSFLIKYPRPHGILVNLPGSSFPEVNLCFATAVFSFLSFYLNKTSNSVLRKIHITILLSILPASGFAVLYLGDYWLSDVIAAFILGILISLIHWIFYRRKLSKEHSTSFPANIFLLVILFSTIVNFSVNYQTLVHNHTPYQKEFLITEEKWWNQSQPVLPVYRHNRIGHVASLLNIQYVGSISLLKQSLEKYGWKKYDESMLTEILKRMSAQSREDALPLLTQLYNNRRPVLLMTYDDRECDCLFVLRIWRSNYHLNRLGKYIWIGSIHRNNQNKLVKKGKLDAISSDKNVLKNIEPILKSFKVRKLQIPENMYEKSGINSILLVKEKQID
ncbi:hypothetical protein E3983_08215 [Legionella israelensis]|uniref:Legionella secretion system protein Y n=1 Tax=Legionella israelensis TaxID=454 RepID=A0AAX1EGZ2_9GAMM|nr:bifunctional DedA family/phosphatase PAP2 family protein [Legionella israelensis]QBR84346.1 hypothetical protein E3983_08215 [Legionella israelensis]